MNPEALLLERCAAQIAAAAGPGAEVQANGAGREAELLVGAVEALPASGDSTRAPRRIVYWPRALAGDRGPGALLPLLECAAARQGGDAILVVAIETPSPQASVQLDRLARCAGWELCQRWTDGFARHALCVFERSDVTET